MNICLVYDCLYPWTIGGGERWYRALAERLAAAGHDVTYLTLRQWAKGEAPDIAGVRVVAVGPRMALYVEGRRRIGPPLVFGAGVLAHLIRHGRRYDAVHSASFPYFSLLAAAVARRRGRYRLVVDWFEHWSRAYWRGYLGTTGGRIGWEVQRACTRIPQHAFCFAEVTARRLRDSDVRGSVTTLTGMAPATLEPSDPRPAGQQVLFVGRHIPEKRAPATVPAIASARRRLPDLRGLILGDGPERPAVQQAIDDHGLADHVTAPGFVESEALEQAMRTALCLLAPSEREGYGLVVLEAAARGVPTIVVAGADNAAVELVEDGVNGVVSPTADPADLADAIIRIRNAGPELRESTAEWYRRNQRRLSLEDSLERVLAAYAGGAAGTSARRASPS